MEVYARVASVLAALAIFMFIFGRYMDIDHRRSQAAQNIVDSVYKNIRENSLITASDILKLYEAENRCRGKAELIVGCCVTEINESGEVMSYRNCLMLKDISEFIGEEGSFVLSRGDTVSIRFEQNPAGTFGNLFGRRLMLSGGTV